MSDIRKWFLKQPHQKANDAAKPKVDGDGGPASVGPKVSKYFSNSTGIDDPSTPVNVTKKAAKSSPSVGANKKSSHNEKRANADADNEAPSPKRVKSSEKSKGNEAASHNQENRTQTRTQTSDHNGEIAEVGTRGGGRGSASIKPEAVKPSIGRGRGGFGRGGHGFYGAPQATPPHKGEKEIPEGADNCLAGLTFVISGTLDSLEREEAEDLIKRYGGRVTSAVSKKTSYLLADEDVGGQKSKKAHELQIPFLKEDGLLDMIRVSRPKSTISKKADLTPTRLAQGVSGHMKDAKRGLDDQLIKEGSLDRKVGGSSVTGCLMGEEIWPEKYKPMSTDEIVGNQNLVKQLRDWLKNWDEHNLHVGTGKGKRSGVSTASKKAVLLSGQPGIGKTTTARLLCKELGYEALEVNASDNRGKADSDVKKGIGGVTANTIKEMVSNESLSLKNSNWSTNHRKSVLIMDEVDGMSGGDRGGITDLIASIKLSKIPIICICNDRYSQKLKALTNYCLPLPFRKATKQQMAKRLKQIACKEGLDVEERALEELADRTHGDMRMALNQLQYMSLRKRVLKYDDIKEHALASAKDEDISPFSAVDKLMGFQGNKLRFDERIDLAMSDLDLIPLIVQENYLNYRPSEAGHDETVRMDIVACTAASIADGDIVNVQIRRYRQWQHAQLGAFMSSIIPAALVHGQREVLVQGERNFNRFGGWFGKNSSWTKKKRLLEDVLIHVLASRICEPTRETLCMDYLSLLSLELTLPLKKNSKNEAVEEIVDLMDQYSLTQEDIESILDITKFQGQPDPLEGVPPALKAALTKAYNRKDRERHIRSADLLPSMPGQKKTKRVARRIQLEPAEVEDEFLKDENAIFAEGDEEDTPLEDEELEDGAKEDDIETLKHSDAGYEINISNAKDAKGAKHGVKKKAVQQKNQGIGKDVNSATKGGKRKR